MFKIEEVKKWIQQAIYFGRMLTEMLKENNKSLKSVALYMRDGVNDKKTLALYDKLYRYKREAINPPNVLVDGVLNYLKKFDKNLMVSDLYSDWSEYDTKN